MKLSRKRDYMFIIFAVVLVVIFIILAIISTFSEIGPKAKITPQIPVTSKEAPETAPRIKYKSGSLGKSLIKLTSRIPLSPDDQATKEKLINIASRNSGFINKTSNYSIDYVRSIDDIEVEILTTNISLAKTEATSYLKEQGLSNQGMCNLPVRFYLNYVVTKELPENTVFNPLPSDC